MKDIEPKFRCAACNRGVLNRSVARCLYCGANLPEEVKLAPELIAQREAEHARREEIRARLTLRSPVQAESSRINPLDVIDGVEAGIDVIALLGDGISALGDLLS